MVYKHPLDGIGNGIVGMETTHEAVSEGTVGGDIWGVGWYE